MDIDETQTNNESDEDDFELMHYTSAEGLHGILTSQTLRATHYAFLNDQQEFQYFLNTQLPHVLEAASKNVIPEKKSKFIYDFSQRIKKSSLELFALFIFSLSKPNNIEIEKNGLLSQWRGYGQDGGYAIVFSHNELHKLLKKEGALVSYAPLLISKVIYLDDTVFNYSELNEFVNSFIESFEKFLNTSDENTLSTAADATYMLAARTKNPGFKEEKEYRIVLEPKENESLDTSKIEAKTSTFIKKGCPVPCIEIFKNLRCAEIHPCLPIKRIIVGPHIDKNKRKLGVELLLKQLNINAEVTVSDIPFI